MPECISALASDGWCGPHPLLEQRAAHELAGTIASIAGRFTGPDQLREAHQPPDFERRPWFKSLHAFVPEVFRLASHPALVGHVARLLGPDVVAWGAAMPVRTPGQVHRWHVDIEHAHWPGVTIFLGLKNSARAGLRMLDTSHRLATSPQGRRVQSDEDACRIARELGTSPVISEPDVTDGHFLVLDGRVWHSSKNRGDAVRSALILQYAPSTAHVRVPLGWDYPVRWSSHRPPCLSVAGSAAGPNWVVSSLLDLPEVDA